MERPDSPPAASRSRRSDVPRAAPAHSRGSCARRRSGDRHRARPGGPRDHRGPLLHGRRGRVARAAPERPRPGHVDRPLLRAERDAAGRGAGPHPDAPPQPQLLRLVEFPAEIAGGRSGAGLPAVREPGDGGELPARVPDARRSGTVAAGREIDRDRDDRGRRRSKQPGDPRAGPALAVPRRAGRDVRVPGVARGPSRHDRSGAALRAPGGLLSSDPYAPDGGLDRRAQTATRRKGSARRRKSTKARRSATTRYPGHGPRESRSVGDDGFAQRYM